MRREKRRGERRDGERENKRVEGVSHLSTMSASVRGRIRHTSPLCVYSPRSFALHLSQTGNDTADGDGWELHHSGYQHRDMDHSVSVTTRWGELHELYEEASRWTRWRWRMGGR